jgi:hypothetical protein
MNSSSSGLFGSTAQPASGGFSSNSFSKILFYFD